MEPPVTTNASTGDVGLPGVEHASRRVLNVWILAGSVIALAVAGFGAYFLRGYQVRRTASSLVQRAEELAAKGEYADAGAWTTTVI